ncbi:uncharacterized protein LOC135429691 [Drosophila montana]|uniref:uncharacterized protein LOC135429691 n=1 Tax=Drosophila montana TaxID=40370 RepID=UPI00313F3BE0
MPNPQRMRHGLGRIRLLLDLVIFLAIWHQCCAIDFGYEKICSPDDAAELDNCGPEGHHDVMINSCPKKFCYRRQGEKCDPDDDTKACAQHLTCSCNRCMNCVHETNECFMDNCPNYSNSNYKKRLPNRLLPWFDRARWYSFLQKFTRPNYED